MKTFNKKTKDKYIERAKQHRIDNDLIQGIYWKDGKGSAVGCLAHTSKKAHEELEKQTGIPEWLAHVADGIFEGLQDGEYQKWPERFVSAMPTNKTHKYIEKHVKAPFMGYILQSTLENFDNAKYPEVTSAVIGSIKLWKRNDLGSEEWSAAWSAVESAACSAARSAAWSAAYKRYADKLIEIMKQIQQDG